MKPGAKKWPTQPTSPLSTVADCRRGTETGRVEKWHGGVGVALRVAGPFGCRLIGHRGHRTSGSFRELLAKRRLEGPARIRGDRPEDKQELPTRGATEESIRPSAPARA